MVDNLLRKLFTNGKSAVDKKINWNLNKLAKGWYTILSRGRGGCSIYHRNHYLRLPFAYEKNVHDAINTFL